jgi:hypothetical protein
MNGNRLILFAREEEKEVGHEIDGRVNSSNSKNEKGIRPKPGSSG